MLLNCKTSVKTTKNRREQPKKKKIIITSVLTDTNVVQNLILRPSKNC